jgi:hypothetical protein
MSPNGDMMSGCMLPLEAFGQRQRSQTYAKGMDITYRYILSWQEYKLD